MVDVFPHYSYEKYFNFESKIKNIINKYKLKFSKLKINYSEFDYKQSINNNKRYLKLVEKVLYEFVDLFPEIRENKVVIFLHGSLARETSTVYSDVDFTFCYDNALRNILIPIEEIICLAMVEIFNLKKRSKVHPIMNNFENLYKEEQMSDITFTFGNNVIEYNNSIYKYKSIYDAINSSRDIKFIMNIYKNRISNTTFKEFCYSYKQLYCNSAELDYSYNINNIESQSFKKTTKQDFLTMINAEVANINECIRKMNIANELKVCEIKSLVKSNPNTMFYNLLCILRRYLNKDFNYQNGININILKSKEVIKLLTKKNCKELYKAFHLKNWYLSKVQYVFDVENLNLSGGNYNVISMDKVNKLYFKHHKKDFAEVTENIKSFYEKLLCIYNILGGNFNE